MQRCGHYALNQSSTARAFVPKVPTIDVQESVRTSLTARHNADLPRRVAHFVDIAPQLLDGSIIMSVPVGSCINQPISVLLVDDHRTFLWGLERLIETAAPAMTLAGKATSRSELFALLPRAKPDVIVLDLDLDGDNALDWLDELTEETAARVLVLVSNSNPAVHQQAVIEGARGVVHKQESAEVILRAIEKIHAGEIWLDRNSLGQVVHALSRGQKSDPDAMKIETLTARERHIIATLLQEKGARNKVVAEKLLTLPRFHVHQICG
jgi:two-component system, NarL family, nitrate/nitrite response regulator NarL